MAYLLVFVGHWWIQQAERIETETAVEQSDSTRLYRGYSVDSIGINPDLCLRTGVTGRLLKSGFDTRRG